MTGRSSVGTAGTQKTMPCRFYALASCTKGKHCPFIHSRESSGNTVCSFYLSGNCQYGDRCVLLHSKPGKSAAAIKSCSTLVRENASAACTTQDSQVSALTASLEKTSLKKTPEQTGLSYSMMAQAIIEPTDSGSSSKTCSMPMGRIEKAIQSPLSQSLMNSSQDESTALNRLPLCPFGIKGVCKFGHSCRYLHGLECPACHKLCLHPDDSPKVHAGHIDSCLGLLERELSEREAGKNQECVVCLDIVMEKPDPRFGLLACDHCVCLDCIRTWRTNDSMGTAKTCPICRTITYLVVPSDTWPTDAASKERIIQDYRNRLGRIDCKHFQYGQGTCPFSTSCLYRHADRTGVAIESKPRFLVCGDDAYDGTAHVLKQVQLFDYLEQYDRQQAE
ncbi:E3 ubiquitin-protein ligase makorin-1 [Batrachochytrium dendrobatidis]|nr:E3 ubiquitin-protein ligase makorin-1 [Batrachochytrium dendrobatidis]